MNQDIKRKWIEALCSGKYEQGTFYLKRDGQYCCLGVLCDLVDPNGWDDGHHRERSGIPSEQILEMAELNEQEAQELAAMNDADQLSFAQIADYIEENL